MSLESSDNNDATVSYDGTRIGTGYTHFSYAESLSEWGAPRLLPRCGGWILERHIAGFSTRDAMGCYPLFACRNWSQLHADIEEIAGELVSLALVADPFGDYDTDYLRHCFADLVVPFKEHFVIDLSHAPQEFVNVHHRRNARQALDRLGVEECAEPESLVNEWCALYDTLIARHGIRGLTAFSRASFAKQLAVPGIHVFRAARGDVTVGMNLWYADNSVAYYHLGAYSQTGYELHASYGLFWHAIEHFANAGLRWLNLGAGAGLVGDGADGLSRFKRGWSTGARTVYFCGRIFDRDAYAQIVEAKNVAPTEYFPAYRKGEFG